MQFFILKTVAILAGIIFPAVCGYPFVLFIERRSSSFTVSARLILSFLIGWQLFSLFFALAGFMNRGFSLVGGVILILLIFSAGVVLLRIFRHEVSEVSALKAEINPRKTLGRGMRIIEKTVFILLACTVLLNIALLFINSTGYAPSIPMLAVWGYKSKVFYLENSIPLTLFTNPDLAYIHQSYPLCYSLMITWSYMWGGGICESLVKLIPPFLGVLIFASLYSILLREQVSRVPAMALAMLFCTTDTFYLCSTVMYADNLLLLYVLWGTYFLYLYFKNNSSEENQNSAVTELYSAFFLLGGAAWVKNEGLLYFLLAALFVVSSPLLRKRKTSSARSKCFRNILTAVLLPCTIFIIPWALFKYFMGVTIRDFSISAKFYSVLSGGGRAIKESLHVLGQSFAKFADTIFVKPGENCFIWYILLISLICKFSAVKNKRNMLLIYMITMPVAIFAVSFIFSTRRIEWHLAATERLVFIPMMMTILFIGFSSKNKGTMW